MKVVLHAVYLWTLACKGYPASPEAQLAEEQLCAVNLLRAEARSHEDACLGGADAQLAASAPAVVKGMPSQNQQDPAGKLQVD